MPPTLRLAAAALATAALLHAPLARADEDPTAPDLGMTGLSGDTGSHWGLGVGVGVRRQPYTGIESKTRALPLVFFENSTVRVLGLGADLKLPSAGPVAFALRLRYAPGAYKASDAPVLNGMDERKGSVLLGGAMRWRAGGYGIVSAELLGDASGHSKGLQAKLGYDLPMRFGAFTVAPNVALIALDRKTVAYDYGVKASEVRLGRPQYDGRSTLNTEVGVRTGYALARNQVITLDLGVIAYGSGIKDSPLVSRSSQGSARIGYLYRF